MPRQVPITKQGLTARHIIQSAGPTLLARTRNVSVGVIKAQPNEVGMQTYTASAKTVRNDDGTSRPRSKVYKVEIKVLNPQKHVEVSCECMSHPFWGAEYSLAKRSAAVIVKGNGKAPLERRPDYRTNASACKHATAVLIKLLSRL